MTGIFISYRREDSGPYAGRLYDALVQHFGRDGVFFDVDTIGPGEDFRDVIQRTCSTCKVLLAVIGRQWATVCDKNGRLRLESKNDTLRIEISLALQNGLRVIPVLVGGAEMPDESALPEDLQALAYRNALDVSDKRFHQDVQILVETLKKMVESISPQPSGVGVQRTEVSAPLEGPKATPREELNPAVSSSGSLPSLLPLYGVIPGKTTRSEIEKIGIRDESIDDDTGEPFRCYEVKGVNFWCNKTEEIVDQIHLIDSYPMPEPWRKLGLRWQNSYDQWLSVLAKLGYSVTVLVKPNIGKWDGHDSFSAKVSARKKEPEPHAVNLTFNYSRGTTATAPGTLFQITVDPLDTFDDDEEAEEETGLDDNEDDLETNSHPSVLPLYGISPGKTSVSELARLGKRSRVIDDETGEPYLYYEVKGISFWYDKTSNMVTHISLVNGSDRLPKKWRELGFEWEKSYDQWLSLLRDLGYSIQIDEEPHIEQFCGHDSLAAYVIGRKEGRYPNEIRLIFMFSNGTTTSAPNTINSLIIREIS